MATIISMFVGMIYSFLFVAESTAQLITWFGFFGVGIVIDLLILIFIELFQRD